MKISELTRKVRMYALLSFILPLLTLIFCLFIYKALGTVSLYPDLNWDKEKIEYSANEYFLKFNNSETNTFTNCPKYFPKISCLELIGLVSNNSNVPCLRSSAILLIVTAGIRKSNTQGANLK